MFSLNNLARDITVRVSNDFSIYPMEFFTLRKNDADTENKGLALYVLSVNLPPKQGNIRQSNYNQNKKMKPSYQQNIYHRWILCGDAANPPHTFVIMTQNVRETHQLLHHVQDTSFLGRAFYLIEPRVTRNKLGSYLPVYSYQNEQFLPLKEDANILAKESSVVVPDGVDKTYYFVIQQQRIQYGRMNATFDSCCGIECDRAKPKEGCTCLTVGQRNNLVYDLDIKISLPPDLFDGETMKGCRIRSWNLMRAFLHDPIDYCASTSKHEEARVLQR
ncbi:MAG: hypothetical protein AAGJ35_05860, partial [Myxococcota bacterium]